jgi:hypothetical protein
MKFVVSIIKPSQIGDGKHCSDLQAPRASAPAKPTRGDLRARTLTGQHYD